MVGTSPLPQRIFSLDGLRAVSIALVLLGHGSHSISGPGHPANPIWLFLNNGHLGVSIFFVISGYLITGLLRREREKTGTISLGAFYWRRTLRIFPAFYAMLGLLVLLTALGIIHLSRADLILSGTYTLNYRALTAAWNSTVGADVMGPLCWYCSHAWSLCLEEQFYLFWPLTLVLIGLKRGAKFAFALVALEPFLRVAVHFLIPPFRGISGVWLPLALDPLMFGALAALREGEPLFERTVSRLRNPWMPAGAAFFLFVCAPLLARLGGIYTLALAPTLESLAILIVLFWAVRNPQTRVGRALNFPFVATIGTLSYSLYLWQQIFLVPWSDNRWAVQIFPLNFLCVFAAAAGSFYLIEQPFLRLKNRGKAALPITGAVG